MSRIGKKIIVIPDGIEVQAQSDKVLVKGKKTAFEQKLPTGVSVKVEGKTIAVHIADETDRQQRMVRGTIASLLQNMIEGITNGYVKKLEINGVGYKVALTGRKLVFNLGFSHPIDFPLPDGIDASVEKNIITISGADKQMVGQVAAEIRALKKPEPYKGKGIKYLDETLRRKAGKSAAATE